VRLLSEIGVDSAIEMARAAGIRSPIERNLSIGLGSASVSPLEMVNAYATFAALGDRTTPYFIREVRDGSGNVLERTEPTVERTLSPETAYLTTRLLQEVIRTGTGESAKGLSPNIAGKTGTTNDATDAWFVGYSPDIAAAVWVGFDQPAPLGSHVSAAQVALPVWIRFMGKALAVTGNREFPVPAGIAFARVDLGTGQVMAPGSGEGSLLPFRLGTLPEPGTFLLPAGGSSRKVPSDDLL
jgi:penicillin-binding protein 1A